MSLASDVGCLRCLLSQMSVVSDVGLIIYFHCQTIPWSYKHNPFFSFFTYDEYLYNISLLAIVMISWSILSSLKILNLWVDSPSIKSKVSDIRCLRCLLSQMSVMSDFWSLKCIEDKNGLNGKCIYNFLWN